MCVPREPYGTASVVAYVEDHPPLHVDDAVPVDDFILEVVGEAFEDDLLEEGFTRDSDLRRLVGVQQRLHHQVPLLLTRLTRYELNIERSGCLRRQRERILIHELEALTRGLHIPLHRGRHLPIILQDDRQDGGLADPHATEFK